MCTYYLGIQLYGRFGDGKKKKLFCQELTSSKHVVLRCEKDDSGCEMYKVKNTPAKRVDLFFSWLNMEK